MHQQMLTHHCTPRNSPRTAHAVKNRLPCQEGSKGSKHTTHTPEAAACTSAAPRLHARPTGTWHPLQRRRPRWRPLLHLNIAHHAGVRAKIASTLLAPFAVVALHWRTACKHIAIGKNNRRQSDVAAGGTMCRHLHDQAPQSSMPHCYLALNRGPSQHRHHTSSHVSCTPAAPLRGKHTHTSVHLHRAPLPRRERGLRPVVSLNLQQRRVHVCHGRPAVWVCVPAELNQLLEVLRPRERHVRPAHAPQLSGCTARTAGQCVPVNEVAQQACALPCSTACTKLSAAREVHTARPGRPRA